MDKFEDLVPDERAQRASSAQCEPIVSAHKIDTLCPACGVKRHGLYPAGGIRGRILVAAVTGPMHRQSATNVDRIVKGAKPGDLPVQARPGSKTAINLKTASINLIVPRGLLVAADAD